MSHQKSKGNKEIKKSKKNLKLKARKKATDTRINESIRALFHTHPAELH
ncbi:hypothetical protein AVDCRST_MAG81-5438 [uncultured Synechococcales cyanobacterium]|uniref:Uncharacterized protein n=1 Tax=uncultured Synechococcales cyanobacterium TaxID=1936017 RepID=A0A6J4VZN2_9CYAN|nr:hypothetical protein AVDCRST_MAG81-5438 [uncultured Synechococcales cyanobacterium]